MTQRYTPSTAPNFLAGAFFVLTILSVVTAQDIVSTGDVPTEADAQKVIEQRIQKESGGRIKILSVKKTDGTKMEHFGVPMYAMDYVLQIEFLESCRWLDHSYHSHADAIGFETTKEIKVKDNDFFNALNREANPGTNVEKGDTSEIKGQMIFQKSEKGWRSQGTGILKVGQPRSRPVTPKNVAIQETKKEIQIPGQKGSSDPQQETKINLDTFGVGQVVAEETAKLFFNKGKIVLVEIQDTSQFKFKILPINGPVETFKEAIKNRGGTSVCPLKRSR